MGCFNQSCFISHLDIQHGDKCAVFPALKPKYGDLNDHAFQHWHPFCLPIYGEYNDYGSLENIEKNENTKALEKYFELTIEQIVEAICGRKDLYGKYSPIQSLYGVAEHIRYTPKDLEKLGFITSPKENPLKDGRNTHIITHPKLKNLVSLCWLEEDENPYAKIIAWHNNKEYHFNSAHNYVSSYLGLLDFLKQFVPNHIFGIKEEFQSRAALLFQMEPAFVRTDIYSAFSEKSQEITETYKNKYRDNWKEKEETEYKTHVGDYIKGTQNNSIEAQLQLRSNFENFKHLQEFVAFKPCILEFLKIYEKNLKKAWFKPALTKFAHTTKGLVTANIPFQPTTSYEQHGDLEEQLALLAVITKTGKAANKIRKSR
jgi:hypothetical protein